MVQLVGAVVFDPCALVIGSEMLCRNPFIKDELAFPCGQCMPCRVNRRRVWTHRIMLEASNWPVNSFVTLTYRDDCLPRLDDGRGNLVPGDLKNWLKRFRKAIEPIRVRYYAVGEYGDDTQRPHFHLALFNYPPCEFGKTRHFSSGRDCCPTCARLVSTWGFGNVLSGELTSSSAQYVAGYVTKKMTSKDDSRLVGRYPEFARMSLKPGIGAHLMHDVASTLLEFNLGDRLDDVPSSLRHGSRVLPLGRYLRRRLRKYIGRDENAPPEVIEALKEALRPLREAADDATFGKASYGSYGTEYRRLIMAAGDAAVASLEAKNRIFKKRGVL